MPFHSRSQSLHWSNRQAFYFEQWIGLLLGAVCLGMSMWSGLQKTPATPFVFHPWLANAAVFVLFHWLLTIALVTIGMSLLGFAFHKDQETNTGS